MPSRVVINKASDGVRVIDYSTSACRAKLTHLLDRYDQCRLECDGLTRVLHTVLAVQHIPHRVVVGRIAHTPTHTAMSPHFWIALEGEWRVNYRARMWLGDLADVPHGVFAVSDYPAVEYIGRRVELEPLHPTLFTILTGRMTPPDPMDFTS
jgi:hypothetical protein